MDLYEIKNRFFYGPTLCDNCEDGYERHNNFNLFLKSEIKEGIVEVPICYQRAIWNRLRGVTDGVVVIPIISTKVLGRDYKTGSTALYNITGNEVYKGGLTRFLCKGDTYYGTNGIILDNNFNPILLTTITEKLSSTPTTLLNVNLYLHPKVFLLKSSIEKFLASKLVPCVLENGVTIRYPNRIIRNDLPRITDSTNYAVSVIIEDFTSKFFYKTSEPLQDVDMNEDITTFLQNNVDQLMNALE